MHVQLLHMHCIYMYVHIIILAFPGTLSSVYGKNHEEMLRSKQIELMAMTVIGLRTSKATKYIGVIRFNSEKTRHTNCR